MNYNLQKEFFDTFGYRAPWKLYWAAGYIDSIDPDLDEYEWEEEKEEDRKELKQYHTDEDWKGGNW